ncbi:LacI family DNA-binding transcriptional regulator [Fodinicola feengrottensis]|uniref:LacI family DNA-binding transcriptional regulator n=1 Tax=Fodinicola feengrottensis TaxID=435914 RepID=A0ABN2IU14_9ACTN
MPTQPTPTMHDVARVAGVSVSTVSRVVNNERYVHDETRAKVVDAIAQLGFQRNEAARALRPGQSSDTVGLVVADVANPFFSAIAQGAEEIVREHGHMLIVGNSGLDYQRERDLVQEMLRRRVDGLLVVPTAHDHAELHAELSRWAPIVYVDRAPRGVRADAVVLDNRAGAQRAVDYLIQAGHQRIGYIGGDPAVVTGHHRLAGYKQALRVAGLDFDQALVRFGNHTAEAAEETGVDLLTGPTQADAIFADNNRMTVGALHAIRRVDGGAGLAGFDDVELADLLPRPIALVTHDSIELGRRAARLLFDRIAGTTGPPRRVTHRTQMLIRGG